MREGLRSGPVLKVCLSEVHFSSVRHVSVPVRRRACNWYEGWFGGDGGWLAEKRTSVMWGFVVYHIARNFIAYKCRIRREKDHQHWYYDVIVSAAFKAIYNLNEFL